MKKSRNSTPLKRMQLHDRLQDAALIGLAALCLFLWMALFTYNQADPGFSHSGTLNTIDNAGGRSGAWLADALFLFLGHFAYLVPLVLLAKTIHLYQRRGHPLGWNPWRLLWRSLGFLVLLVAGTTLADIHFSAEGLPGSAGGILGHMLNAVAVHALNVQGSTLLFLAIFLVGLTAFIDLSWMRLLDLAGKVTLDLVEFLHNLAQRRWEQHLAQKQVRAQERDIDLRVRTVVEPVVSDLLERSKLKEQLLEREQTLVKTIAAREKRTTPTINVLETPQVSEPSRRVQKEKQTPLFADAAMEGTLPPISLLDPAEKKQKKLSPESLEMLSRLLEIKLKEFGVEVVVDSVHPGPVITRFEIQPAAGVKVSRISNLAKDLARSLAVISVRVVEVIPGKTTVGIEIPNEDRQIVRFSEVLESAEYDEAKSPVCIALGHDISGRPIIADLARMPHLLVAGTTGSGKSVGVNAMILSILFKSTPEDARLIMIDPKMLELSIYEGIPHLLCPVVTDMKEAANALRWSVAEMERRYKLMSVMGVRNLASFNRKVKDAIEAGTPLLDPLFKRQTMDEEVPTLRTLPTIVVVVDEFADMMMIVGKKVEELIARIAQKARAAGIHLILATQRPSVDVITGLIKANIPTRIAFQVSSKIDSRTILDQGGAEQLLGHGDMLYLPPGSGLPIRVHGAFVSDDEVHRVVDDWKKRGAPNYIEEILNGASDESGSATGEGGYGEGGEGSEEDPLYDEALRFVTESRRASISAVQRKLKIGYNRAARMIEAMEMAGVVTAMNTNGSREVIAPPPFRD